MNTYIHSKTCTWIFIEFLSIIIQNKDYPKCTVPAKWVNKMAHTYTGVPHNSDLSISTEYCKNMDKLQMHYAKWKKQDSKGYYYMIQFTWHSGKCKTVGTEYKGVIVRHWGGVDYKEQRSLREFEG